MPKRFLQYKSLLHSKQGPFLYLGCEEHDASSFTPQRSSPCLEHLHGLRGRTVAGLASGTSLQTKRVSVGAAF